MTAHDGPAAVYLDYNATTPVAPSAAEAVSEHLRGSFGNPSGGHAHGRRARASVDRAREQTADLLGADPGEIVFTSGGTESNNLALRGHLAGSVETARVVTTIVEHPAVEQTCRRLERRGADVVRLPVDGEGRISVDAAREAIDGETDLVSVMHANNEIGTVQPVAEIAKLADEYGARMHTDAAQTVGKVPVSVEKLGIDLLTVAGHKLYAPKGVGALYVREGVDLEPILDGADHESGLRPGTENVSAIAGLGAACRLADGEMSDRRAALRRRSEALFEHLEDRIDGLALNGPPSGEGRLPNTLNVSFPGVAGADLLEEATGVAASTGSACHEGGDPSPSEVLLATGVSRERALGSVRFSVGLPTEISALERAARAVVDAYRRLIG